MKKISRVTTSHRQVGGPGLQWLAICLLVFGFVTAKAADAIPKPENDATPPTGVVGTNAPKLTIELRDGCLLVGRLHETSLRFESEVLGKMQIPLERIARIEVPAGKDATVITLVNGDSIQAGLADKELLLHSALGELKIPKELIHRLKFSH